MRLSKVKLSGFKSFVDPTIITFPSNLVGVVGPNGCGKSNVIDAVRWVMGESSASRLRGDSITDVIFKGSSSRKPIGAASVELLFDNSASTIKGEYSKYNEISIRRVVSRDGISNYYLNGVRCRRKDITSIFLGTGLGPRSYSIIEQGMISRVIEAKPEEMRVFIEEAAGISKYKERRKETSSRIGRTKENLDRLLDVIEEVEKQIKHLNRQAKTAERYKKMRQNERRVSADILAIRIRDLNENAEKIEKIFSEKKLRLESNLADQRKIEAEIENYRVEQSEKNDTFNTIQANYYKIGSEISRLEQSIEYSIEIESRQKKDLKQAIENEKEVENHISLDKEQITDLENSLDELTLNFEQAKNSESTSKLSLQGADVAINKWQDKWNETISLENESLKDQSVALTQMENLEASLSSLNTNQAKLDKELFDINLKDIETRITHIEKKTSESKDVKDNLEESLSEISDEIIKLRKTESVLSKDFEAKMQFLREREAEQIRLVALQSMSYENKSEETKKWLKRSGFSKNKRIAQDIKVRKGWEIATETVLGDYLSGLRIDSIHRAIEASTNFKNGRITFINNIQTEQTEIKENSLASKVKNAPDVIFSILKNVLVTESLDEAISISEKLEQGKSVITKQGIWLCKDWVRIFRGDDTTEEGVLLRERSIVKLKQQIKELTFTCSENEKELISIKEKLKQSELKKDQIQRELPESISEYASLKSEVDALRYQLEQSSKHKNKGSNAIKNIESDKANIEDDIIKCQSSIENFTGKIKEIESIKSDLQKQKVKLDHELIRVKEQYEVDREFFQDMQIQYESKKTSKESASQNLDRMISQQVHFETRKNEIIEQIELNKQPLIDNRNLLEEQLGIKVSVEGELNKARKFVEKVESKLNTADQTRLEVERQVNESRNSLNDSKEELQAIQVRSEGVMEQLSQTDYNFDELVKEISEDLTLEELNKQLEKVTAKINRLGPINLAAIDELNVNTERKEYLDSQLEDLNNALSTLEGAIRKIDRETRSRFRETFNNVNSGFEKLFPKLFGGGQAYMELIGSDLLTAGVSVMARPPGKRNSTINLLSGGEKALTAVALVFAIFELNPSPFCMLDEVDAPLDDTNVNRFCEIVDEMSKKVQFIIITHNKITMELAKQLSGVTMQEPGVSRLVSVDIDEAVNIATN